MKSYLVYILFSLFFAPGVSRVEAQRTGHGIVVIGDKSKSLLNDDEQVKVGILRRLRFACNVWTNYEGWSRECLTDGITAIIENKSEANVILNACPAGSHQTTGSYEFANKCIQRFINESPWKEILSLCSHADEWSDCARSFLNRIVEKENETNQLAAP